MTPEALVERARALPGVTLKESDRWTNITFRGKGFAWVDHADGHAMVKGHHDERAALLATDPETYAEGWASGSSAWVRIRLDLADPAEVFELVEEGWRMTATKRVVAAYDHGTAVS